MKTPAKYYIFLHISFLLYSLIMLYMKSISTFAIGSFAFLAAYFLLVVFLFVYALIWQQVIKWFPISKAYSHRGVIIIWTLIWSYLFFGETIKWNNLLGALIIISGIIVVSSDE